MMEIAEKEHSKEMGRTIRKLREEKQLSQQDLADRLGITRSAVSKLEHGTRRLTLENLDRVLDALDYELDLSVLPRGGPSDIHWGDSSFEKEEIVREGRRIAERASSILYERFDVDTVIAHGSLVESQGRHCYPDSDIDLLVQGLDPERLFEAQKEVRRALQPDGEAGDQHNVDIVREEQFPVSVDELLRSGRGKKLPRKRQAV